ncbi:alpha/beta hydrolase [Streptomyces sp. NPDC088801]|uniref:alpha/beta hydrolase n=1 Tax=Streptomyces sp. NPDC088801 TaxID=3365903 RepID=UPI0038015278
MRPRLVFVHGIGGLRNPTAELDVWLRALADGARDAGHSNRVLDLIQGWAADTRFAYYGDLFRDAQAQGGAAQVDDDEAVFVREMLRAAVTERLETIQESIQEPIRGEEIPVLRHAQAQLGPRGAPQGPGSVARQVLGAANTLLSVPGLRSFGGWVSARLMVGHLRQVARYLGRGEPDEEGLTLDTRIRRCLERELDTGAPTVVVAHSLGTVVALETLSAYQGDVPLLVTLGSPVGMRAAVGLRMRPQPLRVPGSVGRWLNFWDRDDLIAVRPLLENAVRPNARSVLPRSRRVDSDGISVHPAVKYLAQARVAGPVVEQLQAVTPS